MEGNDDTVHHSTSLMDIHTVHHSTPTMAIHRASVSHQTTSFTHPKSTLSIPQEELHILTSTLNREPSKKLTSSKYNANHHDHHDNMKSSSRRMFTSYSTKMVVSLLLLALLMQLVALLLFSQLNEWEEELLFKYGPGQVCKIRFFIFFHKKRFLSTTKKYNFKKPIRTDFRESWISRIKHEYECVYLTKISH